jgi:broad specificity phosphatase PhoE
MLKIYLARHGQDEDNANNILNGHRDKPLTEIGIKQAEFLAKKIEEAGIIFDYIFTSPLRRAYKTAEIISEKIGISPPVILPELIERDFGIMTGVEISRVEQMCSPNIIKTEFINYFLSPEGAETFPDLLKRAEKVLTKIEFEFTDRSALLVTHGDIGKMLFAQYYDLHWKEVLSLFHFGNSELILLSEQTDPGQAHVFKAIQHNT